MAARRSMQISHRISGIEPAQNVQQKGDMVKRWHLFTDSKLDCARILIETLQQIPSLHMLIKKGRLLPKHSLEVLPPQASGLPSPCKNLQPLSAFE